MNDLELLNNLTKLHNLIKKEISRIIIGQKNVIDHLVLCLLCNGHNLIIGVPGLGKTLMVHTLSDLLDLSFNRIQFTPDLMPADITGTDVLEEDAITRQRSFRFVLGPLFANVILADEINRTPPKTQAALLQAMQEYEVTCSGKTYQLPQPFFVLATQNPIEQEGTYPLPEAELDRFMFSVKINYPHTDEEIEIVLSTTAEQLPKLKPVISAQQVIDYQKLVRRIPVSRDLVEFAVKIVRLTRPGKNSSEQINRYVMWGAGPRASQNLILGAKGLAAIQGKPNPDRSDVLNLLYPVLQHRIVMSFAAEAEGIKVNDVIDMIYKMVN